MVKHKQYVVNVYAKTGEANDLTRFFPTLDDAIDYAVERAKEGKRTNVKTRTVEFGPWEFHDDLVSARRADRSPTVEQRSGTEDESCSCCKHCKCNKRKA